MDTFYPEDEETGIQDAQVDQSGAFTFSSDVAAPQGGFSFVRRRLVPSFGRLTLIPRRPT